MKKLLLKFAYYILRKYNSVVPIDMRAPILYRGRYFKIRSIDHYMEWGGGGNLEIEAIALEEELKDGRNR